MKTAYYSLTIALACVMLGCESPNAGALQKMAKSQKDQTLTYAMTKDGTIYLAPEKQPDLTPEQHRQHFREFFERGVNFTTSKNYGSALAAFHEAMKHDPTSTETRFNIAACTEALGNVAQAMKVYQQLLMIDPNDPDCNTNLGTCYIKMFYRENNEDWREMARRAWTESLRLNPNQPKVERFLREAYMDRFVSGQGE